MHVYTSLSNIKKKGNALLMCMMSGCDTRVACCIAGDGCLLQLNAFEAPSLTVQLL
jgi:hypothetical protein